jgi:type IV pilus assembly protein PilY1
MRKLFATILCVLGVIVIGGSVAQSTRTLLDLRTGPIINSGDVSNLALVLSVEFPTTGAAYKSPNSANAYNGAKKYLGYWNSTTCYAYYGTTSDGYFEPAGSTISATDFRCTSSGDSTKFSGNFLNFAATSATDILRYALTGGDRYVDAAGNTILQRAVLIGDNGGSNASFYRNSQNMPTRSLTATQTMALTPFGNRVMYVQSCEDRVIFQTSDGGTCTTPGNLRTFNNSAGTSINSDLKARIKVCDSTEGPARPELCKQYPDGNYKPVGEIQKNADKVRVAAFGYLLNNPASGFQDYDNWYGGVLRAPMKFAGPNQKNSSGIVSANTQTEWDATTGVFVANPMSEASYSYSGVINYTNRFGRSGQYKRHDPVGEIYYEAVRYFQGKQPTANATTDTTKGVYSAGMLDNYPIYTTWTDPMQTACQRNYSLLIADHQSAKDNYIPGVSSVGGETRAADGSGVGALNATTWGNVITSFETNGSVNYTDSQGVSRTANGNATAAASGTNTGVVSANTNLATKTQTGQSANGNNVGYALAAVAYWANTQSIRSDKPLARLRTFVIDVNEGAETNVEVMRQRALYLAGKYGGFADVGLDGSPATGEGNPFKTYVNGTLTASTSEWLAADGSSLPAGYFLASQPERLILAIRKIFAEASKPSGNIAGGSLSVSRLSKAQQNGAFYQARINSSDWSGTVIRTALVYNTSTQQIESSPTPDWDAANILTGITTGTTTLNPIPLPADRNIVSYSSTSLRGVSFTWANVDAAVQTSLKTDPSTNVVEATTDGQARLDYIRGVRTAETDPALNYRARRIIMGDSINSAPVLKGKPNPDIVDSDYQTFLTTYANRTPTVYIGSNDGMLHAFYAAESATNANNGKELFAYVPRAVSLNLNKLTDPGYVKQAYVDGALTVSEAKIYRSSGAVGWGTALVSGMGGGAKGLFALDVTTPSSFGPANVLWEFTDADDADMGNLLAEPRIVKLAMGGIGNASPNYKWFAMVTSGYNNYTSGGAGDKQALFLLSLEKEPGTAWALGTNYFKLTADNSAFAGTNNAATGMGMPGVATGIAGNAFYAYAGDLQGNLWKFDLRGASDTWTGSTKASVLFKAKIGSTTQPITVIPSVSLNVVGGYQIGFGTGRFIEPNDALSGSAAQQSLYGIWDSGDGKTFERVSTGSGSTSVNGLISRTLTVTSGSVTTQITGSPFVYGTGTGQYRGWYADLSTTMERVAVDPVVDNGLMAVNSVIPGGDPCVATGSSNQYRYNPSTGKSFVSTGTNNTQGYLGSASLLEVGDTAWTTRYSSGRYLVTRRINSISPGVGGGFSTLESTVTSIAGRISWREITNFQ